MDIGFNIKKIRKQQNRTQQEIADACCFTKSLLSKIENDVVVPPVATLSRIAEALGIKTSVLLEEGQSKNNIFTAVGVAESSSHAKTNKGYEFFPFASDFKDKRMQPCLFMGTKGKVIKHSLSHSGEEFIYMLEGEMKLKVGNIEYLLKPGDNIYFDSLKEHGIMPVSDQIKYIDIFVE